MKYYVVSEFDMCFYENNKLVHHECVIEEPVYFDNIFKAFDHFSEVCKNAQKGQSVKLVLE